MPAMIVGSLGVGVDMTLLSLHIYNLVSSIDIQQLQKARFGTSSCSGDMIIISTIPQNLFNFELLPCAHTEQAISQSPGDFMQELCHLRGNTDIDLNISLH